MKDFGRTEVRIGSLVIEDIEDLKILRDRVDEAIKANEAYEAMRKKAEAIKTLIAEYAKEYGEYNLCTFDDNGVCNGSILIEDGTEIHLISD